MAKPNLQSQAIEPLDGGEKFYVPTDEDYSGIYRHAFDGLLYELYKEPEDKENPQKITHRLRVPKQIGEDGSVTHPGFSWCGTKADFKEHFERA